MSYKIESGDTFWSISQKLGVSLQALQAANPATAAESLVPGSELKIPQGNVLETNASPTAQKVVNAPETHGGYVNYSGPASHFPDPKQWASWDKLWSDNERLIKYHDSDAEIADIKKSILQVAKESGVDAQVILCIVVQESGGNVRVNSVSAIQRRVVGED